MELIVIYEITILMHDRDSHAPFYSTVQVFPL